MNSLIKKKYENPIVSIIYLNDKDVITDSKLDIPSDWDDIRKK